MAKSNTIHLWDNSWHVSQSGESLRDLYGREPLQLDKKESNDKDLRSLSSSTIGEMMADEECDIIVWPNSFYDGNEELKEQFVFRISEKEGNKIDSVTTGNVVGFIGRGNTDIRIHSRFSSKKGEKINDYFLYYMLEKVMAINMFSESSSSNNSKNQAFDFLLFFFPKMLKEALSQGMYKKYVYHEYNDANIRGVVDVNRHIRLNIPANGKIAYRTREFSYDNPVTQLIRHTIEFIRRKQFGKAVLHNDPDTEGCVQQIIQATPTFQPQKRQAIINENLRPVVHPYYTKYAALQNLCLRILRYEKLSYGNDSNNKIHGLLIDAAWLWEEYVAKVLSEIGSGLKHYTRSSSKPLFERENGSRFQPIIPDYLDEQNHIVADAKYIPLPEDGRLDAERASAVYYKSIMYMYRFSASTGYLFHPIRQSENITEPFIRSQYKIIDTKGSLYKIGMVIPSISEKEGYVVFKSKLNEKEKECFSNL